MPVKRLTLNDYPWDKVKSTRSFITRLFSGAAPDRPACIVHSKPVDTPPPQDPPDGLTPWQTTVWQATEDIRRRPVGYDDSVPALGTGAGTCAMATAFGAEETNVSGLYWVKPCITSPSQIDTLKKPRVTDGKLGAILDQTKAYAEYADERIAISIMDFQSPFTTVEQMLGSEMFFTMPYDEPERLKALMNIVTDYAIDFFKAQMKAAGPNCRHGIWPGIWFPKCAGIQMSDDNLVNVSPEVYEEFVVPYNNRISKAFGGLFLHSCTITANHLPVLKKLEGITGVNCDLSTSVPIAALLDAFGDHAVVAPHAYVNTNTNYTGYDEFMRSIVSVWKPGKRLFIYPCTVMFIPKTSREIRFDEAEARTVLEEIPAWKRDHGR